MRGKTFLSLLLLASVGAAWVETAQGAVSAGGQLIANNTPKFVTAGKNVGPVDPASTIEVSIRLNVHNPSELDALAQDLYNPKSPNYRHWLSKADFVARFAPTAEEAKTVEDFFTANHLAIVSVGPENFFVRARGTVANVQKAFKVNLSNFEVKGATYRGNTSDPMVEGPAGALVGAVYGLDNLQFQHPLVTRTSLPAGKTAPKGSGMQKAAASTDPNFFTSNCFTGVETESFTTAGSLPDGTFKGNGYTKSIEGCGYTPAQIHTAYNLNALYKEGYDGTGQTIVIIDWCGSPTIKSDANAFSALFGLPPLTAANFKIINYPAPSFCSSPDPEINIDVEWAHAIAPGAAIDLVVPPSALFVDVDNAFLFAAVNQLGSVISGSYGSDEGGLFGTPATILVTENLISEVAAVLGESANFSSGDGGDLEDPSDPTDFPATVLAPADSPWATAVGGVSLALNANNTIKWQSGWGTNENELIFEDFISDPPSTSGFFNFGSGGGSSGFFKKPPYQSSLPGKGRQVPDIAWLADPFTGGIIAITSGFAYPPLQYTVYGGTSLACPMFSALWAIANQEAGSPLGQAAAYLYSMPAGTITDVVPVNSTTNVTATIVDSTATTKYTADQIAAPLQKTTKFISVLWDYPLYQDSTFLITFGTDSSLMTAKGWDNVTGMGTPNGKAFADYFNTFSSLAK
jgi:subtilase family serine protease